jgi:hypothetical protein
MEQVSGWFRAEPTSAVRHLCWVDVYRSGQQVANIDGDPLRIAPTGGSVVFDRTSDTRRSLTMECAPYDEAGTNLIPDPDDPGSPLRRGVTELRVFMGYEWPVPNPETGARVEVVSMGHYRAKKVTTGEDGNGAPLVKVEADVSWLMRQSPPVAYQILGGTPTGAAFSEILQRNDPSLIVFAAETGNVTPTLFVVGVTDNPWDKATKLAQASGCVGFFDRVGRAIMAPVVTAAAKTPVYSFVEGPDATFTEPEIASDAEDAPNVVTIIGTNGGNNVEVFATARDDAAIAKVGGPITRVIRSPLYSSVAQAQVAAAAELARVQAGNDTGHLTAMRQPALSEDDTVGITRAQLHLHDQRAVLSRLEFPLAEATMEVDFQRVPDAGIAA